MSGSTTARLPRPVAARPPLDVGGVPGPYGLVVRRNRVLWADDGGPTDPGPWDVRSVVELRQGWAPAHGWRRAPGSVGHYVLRAPHREAPAVTLRADVARALGVVAGPGTQPVLLVSPAGPAPVRVVVAVLLELLGVARPAVLHASCGHGPDGLRAWADVEAVLADVDAAGGVQRWWAATDQPPWAVEVLRATLLESPRPDRRS